MAATAKQKPLARSIAARRLKVVPSRLLDRRLRPPRPALVAPLLRPSAMARRRPQTVLQIFPPHIAPDARLSSQAAQPRPRRRRHKAVPLVASRTKQFPLAAHLAPLLKQQDGRRRPTQVDTARPLGRAERLPHSSGFLASL